VPTLDVLVENLGATTVPITSLVASSGFHIASQNCPSTLTAGGACTVTLAFAPTAFGASTGAFTITSGTMQLAVPLTGFYARPFAISTAGDGAGVVTSVPDVQCGTACLDNALGTVVLTAAAGAGSVFAGWNATCGTSTTCTIGPGGAVNIMASFALASDKAIAITFAGTGVGAVAIGNTICTSSCTTYVPSGTVVTAFAQTPSTFVNWAGDCSSTTEVCNLGTVIADRAATVTINEDDREVATVLLKSPITGLAMTPDGDLVVAQSNVVSRITLAGTVVWSTAITGAGELATDSSGNVYGVGGSGVFSVTAAGAMRWTRAITVAPMVSSALQSTIAVSPDGTVVAAHTADGAHVMNGSGVDRFTVTGLTSDGMAVASDGTLALGTNSTGHPGQLQVDRYDPTGTALASLAVLPGDFSASFAYDASNDLCAQTVAQSEAVVSDIAPNLGTVFTSTETTSTPDSGGIVVDSTGDLIALRGIAGDPLGLRLEEFSPTGTSTWTHLKNPASNNGHTDGVNATVMAADANHHVAIAGNWNATPWIQVYAMP
jgi:hypothetical protein